MWEKSQDEKLRQNFAKFEMSLFSTSKIYKITKFAKSGLKNRIQDTPKGQMQGLAVGWHG